MYQNDSFLTSAQNFFLLNYDKRDWSSSLSNNRVNDRDYRANETREGETTEKNFRDFLLIHTRLLRRNRRTDTRLDKLIDRCLVEQMTHPLNEFVPFLRSFIHE